MRLSHYLELGKKMKALRTKSGLSQKAMAEQLELSVPYYSNYENGYSEPPVEVLQDFCDILNITMTDLLEFKVSTSSHSNLKTYSDIMRLIIEFKRNNIPVTCNVSVNKQTKRLVTTIDVESPQLSAMISRWNELNEALEKDKMDSDEYNIWIEDLMTGFNIPIKIV